MPDFESILLNTARFGLTPVRTIAGSWDQYQGVARQSVLFFHRIADVCPNPWTMSTSGFARTMEWLSRNFEIVSLDEVQNRIGLPKHDRPSVAITFDDGYAENCEFAIPWLMERKIPFTYYVTLGNAVSGEPFRHDVERGEPLPVNTLESIRALADCGVEIGAHTRTHPNIAELDSDEQVYDEIVAATRELQDLISHPVRHFAFPYGTSASMNSMAVRMAHSAGLSSVASAENGINRPGDHPFHIARIHAHPCLARIQNWLSGDRRMLQRRRKTDLHLQIEDIPRSTNQPR